MQYTLNDILNRYNSGEKLDFVFFWKPYPNNRICESCLGQWWMSSFVIDGIRYNCAEQYMMAEKARLFDGNEKLLNEKIMVETNPAKHREYGRMVQNYDDTVWNANRKNVVVKGNIAKFSQNEQLKNYLLGTGDKILVEASPYDNIWGIKMAADNNLILNPNNWKGQNNLGFALMEVRDILRSEN